MAKLTKEQKAEKAIEKAGGLFPYWLNQHRNKKAGSFENTTASCLTVMAGSAISKCAIVEADGTRNPLKRVGTIIATLGLICEGCTIVRSFASMKQAEYVKTYLLHHPEVREEFHKKVSRFLTNYEADLI